MCGGAVNRQPGYRARNLQRRNSRKHHVNKTKELNITTNHIHDTTRHKKIAPDQIRNELTNAKEREKERKHGTQH